jgi:pyridoxamine 5'-phosphate oxidase
MRAPAFALPSPAVIGARIGKFVWCSRAGIVVAPQKQVRAFMATASSNVPAAAGQAPTDVSALRVSYSAAGLPSAALDDAADPFALFDLWMADAVANAEPEPNAMCLATVSPDGRPAARFVLLKGVDATGFVWYTNYNSRKASHLAANPAAALTFWWPGLERSVRIEGNAARVSDTESDAYFATRPAESRLGAWASEQSEPVDGREPLVARWEQLQKDYFGNAGAGKDGADGKVLKAIPRPPHWGGFKLEPTAIEFWKGRASRLHDRIVFSRESVDAKWTRRRLQP